MRRILGIAATLALVSAFGCGDSDADPGGGGGGGGSGGNADPGPYTLTVSGNGYSPHTQMYAALYDETLDMVTVRLDPPASIVDGRYSFVMTDALVAGHTYRLDQFAELAGDPSPGVCETSDHRWSDPVPATKDLVLNVSHRTDNFSDVACSSFE